MKPSQLIDPADRLKLESAVIEAERNTGGEIVVAVVRRCDGYDSVPWRLGVALAAIALLGLALFDPSLPLWNYLGAQGAALLAGHGLARFDPIRRHLLSEQLVEARVDERARRALTEGGLARSPGHAGILIFVALFERRVVVLAGEGIHASLEPGEDWEEAVAAVVDGLKRGNATEGLIAAAAHCGRILRRHRPARPREIEDLPDAVILED